MKVSNNNNTNISSANLAVTARNFVRLGGNTTLTVIAPGSSNPGNNFQYNSGEYRFKLKSTGLQSGRYAWSFYVGTDRSVFYTIDFEIKQKCLDIQLLNKINKNKNADIENMPAFLFVESINLQS